MVARSESPHNIGSHLHSRQPDRPADQCDRCRDRLFGSRARGTSLPAWCIKKGFSINGRSGCPALSPDRSGFRDSSIGSRLQQACKMALKSWNHSKGGLALFNHDLLIDTAQRRPSGLRSPADLLCGTEGFAADRVTIHEAGSNARDALLQFS
jgi:hypothetical protein